MKASRKTRVIRMVLWIGVVLLAVIGILILKRPRQTTILVMGIDRRGKIENTSGKAGENGQSDMMCVVILDRDLKKTEVIAIPRETVVEVDEYYTNGKFYQTKEEQICLQYAYGQTSEQGCELAKKKVEKLLGIEIDYYCAMSMAAIPVIIDEMDGVSVTMSQDYVIPEHEYTAGNTELLSGEEAYEFIHFRDIERYGTNLERMARQKDFLKAFVPQAKEKAKKNPAFPLRLYRALEDMMTTDIPMRKIPFFAYDVMKSGFDEDGILRIPGEDIHVGEYDEFIVDEERLRTLMQYVK